MSTPFYHRIISVFNNHILKVFLAYFVRGSKLAVETCWNIVTNLFFMEIGLTNTVDFINGDVVMPEDVLADYLQKKRPHLDEELMTNP